MILRELVTRFRFDVDEKGVEKYKKSVDKMKLGLGKLVGGIGIGLLGKQLFNLGGQAEQAEFNLRRFSGIDFEPLRANFRKIQAEINGIRTGAGDVITLKDFDASATSFIQTMGSGKKELESFNQLWAFAAKQSALTGENAAEIVDQLTNAVASGDFAIFQDKIPGFDKIKQQFEAFILEARKVGDPGGVIDLNTRVGAFSRIIGEAGSEQNRAIKTIPDSLLKSRQASKQLEEILQNLGKDIRDLLVPAIKALSEILSNYNKGGATSVLKNIFDVDPKGERGQARTVDEFIFGKGDGIAKKLRSTAFDTLGDPSVELDSVGSPVPVVIPKINYGITTDQFESVPDKARLYEAQKNEINISNTYQINGADPKSVADEITRKQKQQISDAINQVKKQER